MREELAKAQRGSWWADNLLGKGVSEVKRIVYIDIYVYVGLSTYVSV